MTDDPNNTTQQPQTAQFTMLNNRSTPQSGGVLGWIKNHRLVSGLALAGTVTIGSLALSGKKAEAKAKPIAPDLEEVQPETVNPEDDKKNKVRIDPLTGGRDLSFNNTKWQSLDAARKEAALNNENNKQRS